MNLVFSTRASIASAFSSNIEIRLANQLAKMCKKPSRRFDPRAFFRRFDITYAYQDDMSRS